MPPHDLAQASTATPASLWRHRAFTPALVIAVVVALGFGLIIPVLPLFVRSFGKGLSAVGFVVSAFAAARLLSNVFAGALADWIGTARAVAIGAVVVGLSSLAAAAAPTYWALVVYRGVGGFGSALFFTALISLIVRVVGPHQRGRAIGMLQGAFLLGIAVGPGIGGLLAEPLGLRLPFVIYAAFCGLSAVIALVFLPSAPARATGKTDIEDALPGLADAEGDATLTAPHTRLGMGDTLRELLRDSAFVGALIMMAASRWAATGVRFSIVPVFGAEHVGASSSVVGLALTVAALSHLAVLWPAGKVADTAGRRTLGVPAYFAYALATFAVAFASTPLAFVLLLAGYGLATGLTSVTPAAVVADVVPAERTGFGVGVLNTAGDIGSVLGPVVSGLLVDVAGYAAGFGVSALLLAVAAVAGLLMRETLPRAQVP